MQKLATVLFAVLLVCPCRAEDAGFARWWSQFQSAVAYDDKEAIVQMIKFPVEWENLKLRSIKSKSEFLKRFPEIFTPEIKAEISVAKPRQEPGGYSIVWKGRGVRAANEYSIPFKATGKGRYVMDGLYEGPAK